MGDVTEKRLSDIESRLRSLEAWKGVADQRLLTEEKQSASNAEVIEKQREILQRTNVAAGQREAVIRSADALAREVKADQKKMLWAIVGSSLTALFGVIMWLLERGN